MTTPRASKPDIDRVRLGGLMRCCTATIEDLYPNGPAKVATEGQTLHCKYIEGSNHAMVFRDGAWEWDQHPVPEIPDLAPADDGAPDSGVTHGDDSSEASGDA